MTDVALVCGSAGALGSAVVEMLRERGDHVIGADLNAHPPRDGVRSEQVDLTDPDALEALWQKLERDGDTPRFVVNTAGGFRAGSVADSDRDSVRLMSDLNLATCWWSCRSAARHLDAGGAIVNVAARSASSGGAGSAAYAVAKAGVVRLTEVLATELAPRHVRVNAVLPALIDTRSNRDAMSPEALAGAVSPQAIAAVVGFLLSDAAGAVSGALVPVDTPA